RHDRLLLPTAIEEEVALGGLARDHDFGTRCVPLAALHHAGISAHVELRFHDGTGVANEALVLEDRLDVLRVFERLFAFEVDGGNRREALGFLLLLGRREGGRSQQYGHREEAARTHGKLRKKPTDGRPWA